MDGDPVVQDLLVLLLHGLMVAQGNNVELRLAVSILIPPQTLLAALHHELTPLPLLQCSDQVLLPLFLAPVAAHLHLTHCIIISAQLLRSSRIVRAQASAANLAQAA